MSWTKHRKRDEDRSEAVGGEANPPVLTGGLTLVKNLTDATIGRHVDYLTATVPDSVAGYLTAESERSEEGYAGQGFQFSERRMCLGGYAWRRWGPRQGAADWGTEYESWQFAGDAAAPAARMLRGRACRPSRVDMAWDYQCGEGMTPDVFAEAIRPHAEAGGFKLGISGHGDRNTRYIGSPSSERRICVYRKDWESAIWPDMFGPTLRVELRLREDQARGWWLVWDRDDEEGYAAAAGHVMHMTGFAPQSNVGPVPELVVPEGMDAAEQLFQWLEQNGPMLDAYASAGLPMLELAKVRAGRVSRRTWYRLQKLQEQLRRVGVGNLVQMVAGVGGKAQTAATPAA